MLFAVYEIMGQGKMNPVIPDTVCADLPFSIGLEVDTLQVFAILMFVACFLRGPTSTTFYYIIEACLKVPPFVCCLTQMYSNLEGKLEI